MTVPTRLRCGCSDSAGRCGDGRGGAGTTATTGGRRDGENSGRSRVAESKPSGTPHNGLPSWPGTECFAVGAGPPGVAPAALADARPHAHAAATQAAVPTIKRDRVRTDGIATGHTRCLRSACGILSPTRQALQGFERPHDGTEHAIMPLGTAMADAAREPPERRRTGGSLRLLETVRCGRGRERPALTPRATEAAAP